MRVPGMIPSGSGPLSIEAFTTSGTVTHVKDLYLHAIHWHTCEEILAGHACIYQSSAGCCNAHGGLGRSGTLLVPSVMHSGHFSCSIPETSLTTRLSIRGHEAHVLRPAQHLSVHLSVWHSQSSVADAGRGKDVPGTEAECLAQSGSNT